MFLLRTIIRSVSPFPGSKTARKSVLQFKTLKNGSPSRRQTSSQESAKTSRVRNSLDSKVYANYNQVVIAIRDKGSQDFKEDYRELLLFLVT